MTLMDQNQQQPYQPYVPQVITPGPYPPGSPVASTVTPNQFTPEPNPYYPTTPPPVAQPVAQYPQAPAYGNLPAYGTQPAAYQTGYQEQQVYSGYQQPAYTGASYAYLPGKSGWLTRKRLAISGGIAGALVGVGLLYVLLAGGGGPQDILNTAIENQMKLSYVHGVVNTEVPALNSTTTMDYYLESKDPSKVSARGTIDTKYSFLRTNTQLSSEFVVSNTDTYMKLIKPAYDKWLLTTPSDLPLLAEPASSDISRIHDLAQGTSSVFGIAITGNLPKDIRSKALRDYDVRDVYTVVGEGTPDSTNADIVAYKVKVNHAAAKIVQQAIADSLGVNHVDFIDSGEEYTFRIDTKRKLIVGISQESADGTFSLTYSEQDIAVDIPVPDTTVNLEKYLADQK